MEITRTCPFTGVEKTLEIPVSVGQILAWNNGAMIQDVAPELTAGQREFLISGVTEEVWAEWMGSDDDEEESDDSDDSSYQELALQAGMLHGIEAYNDAVGYSTFRDEP